MTKKILYLMHVDWDWIKQRPHFIAEGLSEYFDVKIVCNTSIIKTNKHSTEKDKIKLIGHINQIPFSYTKFLYPLYRLYPKIYIKYLLVRYKPDFLWITFPIIYDQLPSHENYKIIYDCMDDSTGFYSDKNFQIKILEFEKKLIQKASLIFVSSKKLASKLNKLENCNNKLYLIRNAFDGKDLKTDNKPPKQKNKNYIIGYVGTVSSWFDFDVLEHTLQIIKNIEYHIIGPVPKNIRKSISNDRIKFYGPVEHQNLHNYTKKFDCMIMPFKINDLVLSVDPVKFYEYINYNKPIISIYYGFVETLFLVDLC